MAQTLESATQTDPIPEIESETKNINSRAVIDTSPPFGSVEEAVTHFGGRGSWIPHHMLRLPPHFDIEKVEQQAAELEKDLIVKERETLNLLKELEAAKRVVEVLKLKLAKEGSECMATPDSSLDSQVSTPNEKSAGSLSLCPAPSPGLILMELNQAKLNLNRSTNELLLIRASVESLTKKMKEEKNSLGNSGERQTASSAGMLSIEEKLNRARLKLQKANDDAETKGGPQNSTNILRELKQSNFEAVQFNQMAEAASYEVMRATLEIEQTKTSIKMVEMRLIAAKKIEEAARAVEAVALAEMKVRSNTESPSVVFLQEPEGVTLSFEEYSTLARKAQKADNLSKNRAVDSMNHINEANVDKVAILKKLEETTEEVKHRKTSLGEALGKIEVSNRRKVVAKEAFCKGRSDHGQMRHSGQHNCTKFQFKNSYPSYGHRDSQHLDGNESNLINEKSMPVLRSTISIGDILSRKLILQDDFVVGKHMEGHTERQEASLSQMLREQSGLIFSSSKALKDESVCKQFFSQRKKFGFIHVSLPLSKQSKKKVQAQNLR
uniref:WEB family protein n=1 Tax=Davidia involucrata TaxID=16924 RepID=A0A5B7AJP7_DAVIN